MKLSKRSIVKSSGVLKYPEPFFQKTWDLVNGTLRELYYFGRKNGYKALQKYLEENPKVFSLDFEFSLKDIPGYEKFNTKELSKGKSIQIIAEDSETHASFNSATWRISLNIFPVDLIRNLYGFMKGKVTDLRHELVHAAQDAFFLNWIQDEELVLKNFPKHMISPKPKNNVSKKDYILLPTEFDPLVVSQVGWFLSTYGYEFKNSNIDDFISTSDFFIILEEKSEKLFQLAVKKFYQLLKEESSKVNFTENVNKKESSMKLSKRSSMIKKANRQYDIIEKVILEARNQKGGGWQDKILGAWKNLFVLPTDKMIHTNIDQFGVVGRFHRNGKVIMYFGPTPKENAVLIGESPDEYLEMTQFEPYVDEIMGKKELTAPQEQPFVEPKPISDKEKEVSFYKPKAPKCPTCGKDAPEYKCPEHGDIPFFADDKIASRSQRLYKSADKEKPLTDDIDTELIDTPFGVAEKITSEKKESGQPIFPKGFYNIKEWDGSTDVVYLVPIVAEDNFAGYRMTYPDGETNEISSSYAEELVVSPLSTVEAELRQVLKKFSHKETRRTNMKLSKRAEEVKTTPILNLSPKKFPHIDDQMNQWEEEQIKRNEDENDKYIPDFPQEPLKEVAPDELSKASEAAATLNDLAEWLLESEAISTDEYELIKRLYDKL